MNRLSAMMACCTTLAITACTGVVESQKTPSSGSPTLSGLTYSLPSYKYRISLVASTQKPSQEPAGGAEKAETKPEAKPKKTGGAQAGKENVATAVGDGSNESAPTETKPKAPAAPGSNENPDVNSGSAATVISAKRNFGDCGLYDLVISGPIAVADPSARYTLHYAPSIFADDDVKLRVSDNGLLQSVDTKVTDRTGDILVKLAEIGIAIATGVPPAPEGEKGKVSGAGCPKPPLISFLIDPGHPDVNDYNSKLSYLGLKIGIRPTAVGASSSVSTEDSTTTSGPKSNPPGPESGVYYRPMSSYVITLENSDVIASQTSGDTDTVITPEPQDNDASSTLTASNAFSDKMIVEAIVPAPDPTTVARLDFDRRMFIEMTNNVEFKNGSPTSVDYNKPSEALAFVNIPFTIITKVLNIPVDVAKNALTQETSQADLLKKKAEVYKNGTEYLKAKKAFEDEQKAPPAAQ